METMDARFGLKVGQIWTKWDKSNCLEHILVHSDSPNHTIADLKSPKFGAKPGIQRKKYPKKGNNSVILKDKNSKNLHNLHMAITNVNP